MCLTVSEKYEDASVQKGFKVVRRLDNKLVSVYFTTEYIVDVWLMSTNGRIVDSFGGAYSSGFHIFKTRTDAEYYLNHNLGSSTKYGIVECEYKDCVAKGYEQGFDCKLEIVVARRIKILCEQ